MGALRIGSTESFKTTSSKHEFSRESDITVTEEPRVQNKSIQTGNYINRNEDLHGQT